jgi:hypothetical protein
MEREAVLDQYFNDITVEKVNSEKEAWNRLKDNPLLWSNEDTMVKKASDNKFPITQLSVIVDKK